MLKQNETLEDNFEIIGQNFEFPTNNNCKFCNERAEAFADGDINFDLIYKNNAGKVENIWIYGILSLSYCFY